MANLQKAKQAAAQVGMQPPAGVNPGTPQYDQWVQQWFDAGVAAGDPRLVEIAGPEAGGYQAEGEGGHISDWKNAAPSSEWLGKRKPNAQELRRWAKETGRSEDYERFPDATVSGWINKNWDVGKGTFLNNFGDPVDKPDERGPNTPPNMNGTGDVGNYGASGPAQGGGGGGGQPAAPVAPTTFGNQLGMTGNPMQDMLVNQFNTGQNATYNQGNNLFGLGEDRQMGGTGANADQQSQNKAQSLAGGGLWWGQSDGKAPDTFQGFRADQKNATAPAAPAITGGGGAAKPGACPPGQTMNAKGQCVSKAAARGNENSIAGMANNQYNAGGA